MIFFFQVVIYLAFLQNKCLFRLDSKPVNSKYWVAWIIGVDSFGVLVQVWVLHLLQPNFQCNSYLSITVFVIVPAKRLSKHLRGYNSKHVKLQMF